MSRLVAEGVSCDYGSRRVLHEVSIAISRGELVAIVGPTGSGKTTLLWVLAGLRAASGRVTFEGYGERPSIGVALQPAGLWEHLPAWRHLDLVMAGGQMDRHTRRRDADAWLARLGLSALRQRRPPAMSSGERQRLSLARALAARPSWLLLDEPLAHLDPDQRSEVLAVVRDAQRTSGAGALVVTHHGAEVMAVADRIAIMEAGRFVQLGTPAEVFAAPVSLGAARLLGEALAVEAAWRDHELHPASGSGIVVRPAMLRFQTAADGPWVVTAVESVGAERWAHLRPAMAIDAPPLRTSLKVRRGTDIGVDERGSVVRD